MILKQRFILLSGFLISFGFLSVLYLFGILGIIKYGFVLWPISIILFGVYFVLKGKRIAFVITLVNSFVIAIVVLSIVINTSISSLLFFPNVSDRRSNINPNITYDFRNKVKPNNNYEKALLKFKSENGEFFLRGHSVDLIEYDVKKTFGDYILVESEMNEMKVIDIKFDKERIPWKIFSEKNFVDIKLNPNLLWDLNFDIYRSNIDLDLTYYKINLLYLNASTLSSAKINVDANCIVDTLSLTLKVTGSSVDLRIDENVGVSLDVDSKFSIFTFDKEKLIKQDNVYKSLNFDKAQKKLFIKGNLSSSKINVTFN